MKKLSAFFGESFVPLSVLFVFIIAGTWYLNGVAEEASVHVKTVEVVPSGEEWSEEMLDESGIGDRAFDANVDPALTVPEVLEARKLSRSRDYPAALALLEKTSAANPGNAALQNELAVGQLRVGEVDAAIATLEKTVGASPEYFRAWYNLGVARARAKNPQKALEAYAKSASIRPQHFETAHNMGLLLLEMGKNDEALATLEGSIDLAAGDNRARAWFSFGVALGRVGREAEAIHAYNKAIEYRPAYVLPRYNQAVLYASKDDAESLEQAQRILEQILKLSQDFAPAWFLRGRLASKAGDGKLALENYDRAARIAPGFWKARYNAGLLALRLDRLDEAEERFSKLAADWPKRAEPLFNLAQVASRKDDLVRAEQLFGQAIKIAGGTYPEAEVNLGLVLRDQDRNKESLAIFDDLLKRDPSYAPAQMNRALVLMSMDRLDDARLALNQAIAADPSNEKALYNLGKVEEKAKRHKEAAEAYEKVLQLNPGHLKAAVNLGIEKSALGDLDGAVAAYQKALAVEAGYSPAWYNLGVAYRAQNRLPEAADAYLRVLKADPENGKAYQNLGVVYAKMDKLDQAIEQFEAALALDPGDADARYNLALQLRKQGKDDQAEAEFGRVLGVKPGHRKAASDWASLKFSRKDYAGVVALLQPFADSGKATDSLTARLIRAYVKLGDTQRAAALLNSSLKKFPDSKELKQLQQEMGPAK